MICIDNSDEAFRAAKRALSLHKRDNSKVVAFHSVVHKLTEVTPIIGKTSGTTLAYQIYHDQINAGKNALNQVKTLFDESNVPLETRLIDSKEPFRYIKEKVEEEGFDLVILGCRGEHLRIKHIIGTVPERVLNDVPCDILVVRKNSNPFIM